MPAIKLVTEVPGPRSLALTARRAQAVPKGVAAAGTCGNVVRVLVPLTVSDEVLDEGLEVLEAALQAALH